MIDNEFPLESIKMKADNTTTDHNRTILITGLPDDCDFSEMEITIGYPGEGSGRKGVALDHYIIPEIIKAINGAKK